MRNARFRRLQLNSLEIELQQELDLLAEDGSAEVTEEDVEDGSGCALSENGTEVWEFLDDTRPSMGCPAKFYSLNMVMQCIEGDQCGAEALEPGCYFVHCCEPCVADCKECIGPLPQDCLVCGSGKLLFVHKSGRRQCIRPDTCVKMGCFRPTAEGTCERDLKRWDCDGDEDDEEEDPERKVGQLEQDDDACAYILPELAVPKACSVEPSMDCSFDDPRKLCFHDETCSDTSPRTLRLGCGAGGYPNCRWCGFGEYNPCPIPERRLAVPNPGRRRRSGAGTLRKAVCLKQPNPLTS